MKTLMNLFKNRRFRLNFLFLILVINLFGCASGKYRGTSKWVENNTVTISSDNLKEYYISSKNQNVVFTNSSNKDTINMIKCRGNNCSKFEGSSSTANSSKWNNTIIQMQKFKIKGIELSLHHPDYDTIYIELKRNLRYDALAKDVGLSLFTYGIPLLIDVFKSDFYRLKNNSKSFNVHFEYNQQYMRNEYFKISKLNSIDELNKWISKFPKSDFRQNVINHKDSLEFKIALLDQKESSIDAFILSHSSSKFITDAKKVKDEMKAARESFESSKVINTTTAFKDFLTKYPNSLHNAEAHKLLVDAAEREALSSLVSEKLIEFIKVYFIPNVSFLDQKTLVERRKNLRNKLEEFITLEAFKNDKSKQYENYSSLWKRYVLVCSDGDLMKQLSNFDKIEDNLMKISDILFNSLKQADTKEKQMIWKEKSMNDFPKLSLVKNLPMEPENILFSVLDNQKNGNGLIKIFNDNYLVSLGNDSRIDNGLIAKYNSGKYEYKTKPYNALKNSNYQEINLLNGQLNGMSKAYDGSKLLFSFNSNIENREQITDEISYYLEGKIVKTIYISKGFTVEGQCIVDNDFSYDFENGVNLTLKELDGKIAEGKELMKTQSYEDAISVFEKARKNNLPIKLSQNVLLDNCILTANQELSKKQKEEEQRKIWAQNELNKFTNKLAYRNSEGKSYSDYLQEIAQQYQNKSEEKESSILGQIKEAYCTNMNGGKYKIILYEEDVCHYILFNNSGGIQKALIGKWTRRNLGVYGGWTTTITLDYGSFILTDQMNGYGGIQALIDTEGNYWQKCY